jgi:hypothetical protein
VPAGDSEAGRGLPFTEHHSKGRLATWAGGKKKEGDRIVELGSEGAGPPVSEPASVTLGG